MVRVEEYTRVGGKWKLKMCMVKERRIYKWVLRACRERKMREMGERMKLIATHMKYTPISFTHICRSSSSTFRTYNESAAHQQTLCSRYSKKQPAHLDNAMHKILKITLWKSLERAPLSTRAHKLALELNFARNNNYFPFTYIFHPACLFFAAH